MSKYLSTTHKENIGKAIKAKWKSGYRPETRWERLNRLGIKDDIINEKTQS